MNLKTVLAFLKLEAPPILPYFTPINAKVIKRTSQWGQVMTQQEDTRIRVGVVGFGNYGKAAAKAVGKCRDMELVAIFSKRDPQKLQNSYAKVYPTDKVAEFADRIDVVIICDTLGTKLQQETPQLAQYFHTVDSHPLRGTPPTAEEVEAKRQLRLEELERMAKDIAQRQAARDAAAGVEQTADASAATPDTSPDTNAAPGTSEEENPDEGIHEVSGMMLPAFIKEPVFQPVYQAFPDYFAAVDQVGQSTKHVSLCAVGWEPGLMSMFRIISDSLFPKTKTYTFWGRGISMQWSNAIRTFEGVLDAVAYQVPKEDPLTAVLNGEPIYDDSRKALHYMECYVVADPAYDKEQLREEIMEMPGWFADYDTQVTFLSPDEMREFHSRLTHAGLVLSRASTSQGVNEQIKLEIDMDDNPEFTAYVMVAAARAAYRAGQAGWSGAHTMMEIPPIWMHPDPPEKLRFQTSGS